MPSRRRAEHKKLRALIADDATWEPTAKRKWKRVSRTPTRSSERFVWRAGRGEQHCARARRSSSASTWSSGSAADVSSVSGRAVSGRPKLFQVVEVKAGKIVRMRDYGTMQEALAATGHDS